MGYDAERFEFVDGDLICAICLGVLEQPLITPCRHTFCKKCIHQHLDTKLNYETLGRHPNFCPIDKSPLSKNNLCGAPVALESVIKKLLIKCDFKGQGCRQVMPLEKLAHHASSCPFNPNGKLRCDRGCNLVITRKDIPRHKCSIVSRKVQKRQKATEVKAATSRKSKEQGTINQEKRQQPLPPRRKNSQTSSKRCDRNPMSSSSNTNSMNRSSSSSHPRSSNHNQSEITGVKKIDRYNSPYYDRYDDPYYYDPYNSPNYDHRYSRTRTAPAKVVSKNKMKLVIVESMKECFVKVMFEMLQNAIF